ncbi:MAG: hypothetical protein ACUZ8E_00530, partial [Candidatus Anammoxibacter sp.]
MGAKKYRKLAFKGTIIWVICFLFVIDTAFANHATLAIGDRVEAVTSLNVRNSPGGSWIGSRQAGSEGTIKEGFVNADFNGSNFNWWK